MYTAQAGPDKCYCSSLRNAEYYSFYIELVYGWTGIIRINGYNKLKLLMVYLILYDSNHDILISQTTEVIQI